MHQISYLLFIEYSAPIYGMPQITTTGNTFYTAFSAAFLYFDVLGFIWLSSIAVVIFGISFNILFKNAFFELLKPYLSAAEEKIFFLRVTDDPWQDFELCAFYSAGIHLLTF